jgi:hypothetical protein
LDLEQEQKRIVIRTRVGGRERVYDLAVAVLDLVK